MHKILITCPPMINRMEKIKKIFIENDFDIFIPKNFKQTLSENELLDIIHQFDIWIVGDDPVTNKILNNSKLKMIIKWGIGIDNIDIDSCKKLNIKFTNTPNMFGEEVSDVAIGYLLMLTRQLHIIHNEIKDKNNWYKPVGISLHNKKISVIGYGNIGKTLCRKLLSFNMNINVYDPLYVECESNENIIFCENIEKCVTDTNFIISTCPLNKNTYHIINKNLIKLAKKGVYIINVSRGSVIKELDLIKLLDTEYISGAALDVFEKEPLDINNKLKNYNCILGSHNGSNTIEAVDRTNMKVLNFILENI